MTAGFASAGALAWWLARYQPLGQTAYAGLRHSVTGEAELPVRIDPERLRRHTISLATISNRRGGTPGEAEARNWVAHRFKEAGLSRVHLEPVIYPRWRRRRRSDLTFFTPAPYAPDFVVLNGSAATEEAGIERWVVDVGRGSEADYAVRTGRGLSGAVHLITRSHEHRRLLVQRATAHGAAAVILAHPVASPKGKPLIENGTALLMGRIPALAVSYETGRRLREWIKNGRVRALMHISVGYSVGATANVVGEIPGKRREYIALAAHFDAWYAGAADNAAGLACLLELARVWTQSKLQPCRTIRFISYAAEEEALMGSLFEVVTRVAWVKARCRGVITPDVVGVPGGELRFSGYPAALAGIGADLALQMGYQQATGYPVAAGHGLIYGDHWPYAQLLLPALAISKGPDPFYHTPYDTADRLDYEDARWTAAVAGAMALRLAER